MLRLLRELTFAKLLLETRKLPQLRQPGVNFRPRRPGQPAEREIRNRKRRDHRAIGDRGLERIEIGLAALGDVAEKSAGKTVTGAGRVVDLGGRVGGQQEPLTLLVTHQ